eukprot:UN33060
MFGLTLSLIHTFITPILVGFLDSIPVVRILISFLFELSMASLLFKISDSIIFVISLFELYMASLLFKLSDSIIFVFSVRIIFVFSLFNSPF